MKATRFWVVNVTSTPSPSVVVVVAHVHYEGLALTQERLEVRLVESNPRGEIDIPSSFVPDYLNVVVPPLGQLNFGSFFSYLGSSKACLVPEG